MLDELVPLWWGRDYVIEHWLTELDKSLIEQNWENKDAFMGSKYADYASYSDAVKPNSILEVGVKHGYSIATLLKVHEASRVVLIDKDPILLDTAMKLHTEFPAVSVEVYCIDSQTQWQEVPQMMVDIVHIDGDHNYECARADMEHFAHLARELVVVDDAHDPAVFKAATEWNAGRYPSRFINNHNGHYLVHTGSRCVMDGGK